MSDSSPPADDSFIEDEKSARPIEKNLKSRATWTRFLYMVLACVLVSLAGFVGFFVVVLGFLMVLFTGEVNRELRDAGQSIATYIYQNARYLTFNTDDRPFPFGGRWPSAGDDAD